LGDQLHAPAALPLGKRHVRYILHRRLGGPQGQSEQVQKILPLPEFTPWTIQPTASHYRHKYWVNIPNKMLKWRQTLAYDDLRCFRVVLLTDTQTLSHIILTTQKAKVVARHVWLKSQ